MFLRLSSQLERNKVQANYTELESSYSSFFGEANFNKDIKVLNLIDMENKLIKGKEGLKRHKEEIAEEELFEQEQEYYDKQNTFFSYCYYGGCFILFMSLISLF